MTNIFLYFHTLRYLRPVQIYGRLWFRINPVRPNFCPKVVARLFSGQWAVPIERPSLMIGERTFRFLNSPGCVTCAADWNDPAKEKLWLYNLHYFNDLNAVNAVNRVLWHQNLITYWVLGNPPGVGNGWESYPTSLRIVNWIKWVLAGNTLTSECLHNLGVQVRWLRRRIEWHLLGNHLFANAKALVLAGLFFEGDEGAEWLATGLQILKQEVPEQILVDGGHFERSPMYHAIILEDLLDLVNAAVAWPGCVPVTTVEQWREAAQRMLRWFNGLTHPDGEIAFFNDAAFGIASNYLTLKAYAKRLKIESESDINCDGITHFADSGYVRLVCGDAVALLDVAPIGPDYLPGHAHADTLSFELSLFGQRVVVNSGTSQYGINPERLLQRATAAHSTVQVDDANSSEVWGGFRVARRAHPFDLLIEKSKDVLKVTCSHDGYHRLSGQPTHHRCWSLANDGLQVSDTIKGHFYEAVARYYFHPSVTVTSEGDMGWLSLSSGQKVRWAVAGGEARVLYSTWHPEFGLSIPNQCLEIVMLRPTIAMKFFWR